MGPNGSGKAFLLPLARTGRRRSSLGKRFTVSYVEEESKFESRSHMQSSGREHARERQSTPRRNAAPVCAKSIGPAPALKTWKRTSFGAMRSLAEATPCRGPWLQAPGYHCCSTEPHGIIWTWRELQ